MLLSKLPFRDRFCKSIYLLQKHRTQTNRVISICIQSCSVRLFKLSSVALCSLSTGPSPRFSVPSPPICKNSPFSFNKRPHVRTAILASVSLAMGVRKVCYLNVRFTWRREVSKEINFTPPLPKYPLAQERG